jgi:hypothetical protein
MRTSCWAKAAAARAAQLEGEPTVVCVVVAESMRDAIPGSGYVNLSARVATVVVNLLLLRLVMTNML